MKNLLILVFACLLSIGCEKNSSARQESRVVEKQQRLLAESQPVHIYETSLEKKRVQDAYDLRMEATSTWTVVTALNGDIVFDCPSSAYGIPYGVSLTSPEGFRSSAGGYHMVLPQAEPTGLYTNGVTTSATWVPCVRSDGALEMHYVEGNITTVPYPLDVDYKNNCFTRADQFTDDICRGAGR